MVDPVWEHGEKRGSGFKCKYCGTSKSGGGATRFKDHLAHRGHDVIDCPSVPPAVKNFFISELDKIKAKKYERQQDRRRRDAAARSTQYVDLEGEEEEEEQDDELQQALRHSREEYEFRQRAGPRYERGGGSGSGQARDPGTGVTIPTGRDIDGKYLSENVEEIKKEINKWKQEFPEYGATIICDSWTGISRNSVINFLVYCNGMMYFWKSIDVTGKIQDHRLILKEITIVLNDIGPEDVIQIVTDNGSNFKKACKLLAEEYPHIVWQPCLAHTINLILKDIGKWDDHKAMIQSAQYICQWLYNSNSVHSMFKSATGGELVKWNATRFGTNYMFLESFMKKKDQFMVWMMSTEYRSSRHYKTEAGKYAFECMTSVQWWANMQYVINDVEPLYSFLRFADQDKTPTLGEVLMEYGSLKRTYHTRFHSDMARCDRIMEIVDRRLASVFEENVFGDLRKGLERLFDIDRAARALQENTTSSDSS
ncbi:uncharacterized protein LOC120674800 [Panicum virgatum]|uniref:uncharacterized protein LOC120674800 n=1 Tax=Panicum virgatum TaxID=38727 RepID=UPI0019D5F6B9|nr:uncharacterized protein LOC120674800 [Panicum virgatum]